MTILASFHPFLGCGGHKEGGGVVAKPAPREHIGCAVFRKIQIDTNAYITLLCVYVYMCICAYIYIYMYTYVGGGGVGLAFPIKMMFIGPNLSQ